jgi:hypothetical protein
VIEDRNFIGMELDKGYFEIAGKRVHEAEKDRGRHYFFGVDASGATTARLADVEPKEQPLDDLLRELPS